LPLPAGIDENVRTVFARFARVCIPAVLASAAAGIATTMVAQRHVGPALSALLALVASALVGGLLMGPLLLHTARSLTLIRDTLDRFSRGELAPRPEQPSPGPLAPLVAQVDSVGAQLRQRQQSVEQSERLLHTLMDAAPMAILLFEDAGGIEYANDTARTLFFEGRTVEGVNFLSMLSDAPAAFREAVLADQDQLFSVHVDGSAETYHLAKRHFELHGNTHTLLMVKHLSRELRKQEIDIWKKLVRVVSHELNNSLAPIKSLVHSARIMTRAETSPKLERVFATIDERATHLQGFVESYARFARLPTPRKEAVDMVEFLTHVGTLMPQARVELPKTAGTASFDRSQLEQVIINLLKNAREASGPGQEVSLASTVRADGAVTFVVTDRGSGMSQEVLESAMLPFFSTKEGGSGLGLALAREIVEAHGGTIRLENRDGGGLAVTCALPGPNPQRAAPKSRLTLSRVTTGPGGASGAGGR
jgi:two-component system nitrogen regulation sensor histidine kinase NtrY